ncbi:formate dehydrogenase F4B subunit [Rhizobium subbaraonis]|uniref:Formate dehydrogenase F4B subunit n=1 Tax=Rhizobium subbaraonis TaxID=908946 RepID=A0A285U2G6_9HYPH|nr:hypothetical protein [Rhizobium subbaraonis]SOC36115.1 formate dehydrogenase F4B subunit [Rhizobium subbaraonis]
MSGHHHDAEAFLALVEQKRGQDTQRTPIQAAILTALELGIANDSRTFSRLLGISHALVLRELTALTERGDALHIVKRDERTLRTHYEPLAGAHPRTACINI